VEERGFGSALWVGGQLGHAELSSSIRRAAIRSPNGGETGTTVSRPDCPMAPKEHVSGRQGAGGRANETNRPPHSASAPSRS
jgi:hypothetical protein